MTCPGEDTLSLHLDGALEPTAAAALDAHTRTCDACRQRLETLRALDALLARPEPLPAGALQRALLVSEQPVTKTRPLLAAGAVAAVVLVVLLAGHRHETEETSGGTAARPPVSVSTPAPGPDFAAQVRDALVHPGPDATAFLDEAGDRALGLLHRLARDRDTDAARAAIARLGRLALRESLPVLVEAVARADRRDVAIDALGRVGEERALSVLEPWLDDPVLGAPTLDAFVRIGGADAVGALTDRVEAPNGVLDPAALVAAIGRVDGATGARALARLLENQRHAGAALAALRANEAALGPHLHADATGVDRSRSDIALAALERLASPDSVPVLERLLRDRARRGAAARILARIDTPEAASVLAREARRPEVRDAFRLAGGRTEVWLLASLDDATHDQRVRRIDLLGLCGRGAAVARLEVLAEDPSLAPHAVTALGRIGGDAAAVVLASLAGRASLRRPAIEALGWTGAPAAVALLEDLGRSDRSLRDPVFRALGRLGSAPAVAAILRLDERRGAGGRAGRALSGMEREVVVPALLSMLDGEAAGDARRALSHLGHRGPTSRTP